MIHRMTLARPKPARKKSSPKVPISTTEASPQNSPGNKESGSEEKSLFHAGFGVRRKNSKTPGIRLEVSWSKRAFLISLEVEENSVLEGSWETSLTRSGQPLASADEWELVCRHHSPEVSYLEAVQTWTGGVKLWRHVLLARKDRTVLLGEAVTGGRPGDRWQYSARWSLAPSIRWQACRGTTDGWLSLGRKKAVRVLPIFAPEWKGGSVSAPGRTGQIGRGLLKITKKGYSMHGVAEFQGRAFFAPIWLDCLPRHFSECCTWRQLTIAENHQPVPQDVAAAYRVQIGDTHWLLYRTLGPTGKRSFFGHQLVSEFLLARFDRRTGTVHPLVELVEVPE